MASQEVEVTPRWALGFLIRYVYHRVFFHEDARIIIAAVHRGGNLTAYLLDWLMLRLNVTYIHHRLLYLLGATAVDGVTTGIAKSGFSAEEVADELMALNVYGWNYFSDDGDEEE